MTNLSSTTIEFSPAPAATERHRRHQGAVRQDPGAHRRQSRRVVPRQDDRARRGRGAAEDAERDCAPHILLVGLTIVFLIACVTLVPLGIYSGVRLTTTVIVALLVCLIPTTIGGLLSAIGIAGMDRLMRKNVIAMSGRAVEAAGDVDVLLLDKTGTITLGNRMATELLPAPGVRIEDLAEAAMLSSLADETPEGRSTMQPASSASTRRRCIASARSTRCEGLEARAHVCALSGRCRCDAVSRRSRSACAWLRHGPASVPSRIKKQGAANGGTWTPDSRLVE